MPCAPSAGLKNSALDFFEGDATEPNNDKQACLPARMVAHKRFKASEGRIFPEVIWAQAIAM